jgi:hypothetical protein
MSFLKPKPATSSSDNVNNGMLTNAYSGQIGSGTGATNFLAQLLGVPGSSVSGAATGIGNAANGIAEAGGATGGFHDYAANAGYANALQALQKGVVGGQASQGMLRSGATGTALLTKGRQLDSSMYDNYLQHLSGLSGLGLQAGGILANSGQRNQSTGGSPSTIGSIASTVGGIASIFSDRRLKTDIEKVGELDDGLGLYAYRYVFDLATTLIGVMADEVAKLRPWALGPKVHGFATVNYEAL